MVDDDWLHFVGFIIYGFVSTSAHFDSIWFNPIQFNPIQFGFILFSVSSCIEFHKRLVFVCFIGVLRGSDGAGWARDGAGASWWLMDGGRLAGCGAGICVVRSFEFGQWSWVLIDRVWVCARVSELQSLGEWSCARTSSAHDLLTLMAFDLLIPCFLSSSLALLIIC